MYEQTLWQDHVTEFEDRYTESRNDDGTITHTPVEGEMDKATGFISYKSKNGRELKALELPGLWNGAMSDWNTVFVEVPLSTFNPVKTVNDLLREQHQ